MITLFVATYAEFKTLMPALLGTGADVQVAARDGVATNTGFEMIGFDLTKQLAIRSGGATKPATFDTDFPKRKYVVSITVV